MVVESLEQHKQAIKACIAKTIWRWQPPKKQKTKKNNNNRTNKQTNKHIHKYQNPLHYHSWIKKMCWVVSRDTLTSVALAIYVSMQIKHYHLCTMAYFKCCTTVIINIKRPIWIVLESHNEKKHLPSKWKYYAHGRANLVLFLGNEMISATLGSVVNCRHYMNMKSQ